MDQNERDLVGIDKDVNPATKLAGRQIGVIFDVSCGMFDKDNMFLITDKWPYNSGIFSHHTDVRRPKFRLHAAKTKQQPFEMEWMDLYESNLQGVIFESPPGGANPKTHVVYFAVGKPPQFYKARWESAPIPQKPPNNAPGASDPIRHRIPYPHFDVSKRNPEVDQHQQMLGTGNQLDVLGVPWTVQYSRVIRVEYEPRREFNLQTFAQHLSQPLKETIISLQLPKVGVSKATGPEVRKRYEDNMKDLQRLFDSKIWLHSIGCRISVLKLFYNCSISILTEEFNEFIKELESADAKPIDDLKDVKGKTKANVDWFYIQGLNVAEKEIRTSQIRSLLTFEAQVKASKPPPVTRDSRQYMVRSPDGGNTRLITEREPINPIPHIRYHLQAKSSSPSRANQRVFEVLVYPSHVEISGPILPVPSSITEMCGDKLLAVRFVDNHGKSLRAEAGIDLYFITQQRVAWPLGQQVKLLPSVLDAGFSFQFLGYSMSGVKKRKVWFYHSAEGGADEIRRNIGDWTKDDPMNRKLANNPSLWGARLALAFTESISVASLEKNEWSARRDEGANLDFPNTDGCGIINEGLVKRINSALAERRLPPSQAFQIRFGGVKGVVYRGANLLFGHQPSVSMLLRNSQIKFPVLDTARRTLRVVPPTTDGFSSLFFMAALKAFEDSGANTEAIEGIFDATYRELSQATSIGLGHLQQMLRIPPGPPTRTETRPQLFLLKLALCLKEDKITIESYQNTVLHVYLIKTAENFRDKKAFDIPIPGSYNVLGLTDDYRVLGGGQVFIRAQGKTISGDVLLYRDPIIHIGDIQRATAVNEADIIRQESTKPGTKSEDIRSRIEALATMDNVIFFSQFDTPPLPNKLSGGDLDGDRFEVVTMDCKFWDDRYNISSPDNYTAGYQSSPPSGPSNPHGTQIANQITQPFHIGDVANFVGNYIRNDCFQELQDLLMCQADRYDLSHPTCKLLAPELSKAVDYIKSGKQVDLVKDVLSKQEYMTTPRPDFLGPIDTKASRDIYDKYTVSPKLLGRIYRKVQQDAVRKAWLDRVTDPKIPDSHVIKIQALVKQVTLSMFYEINKYLAGPDLTDIAFPVDLFSRKPHDDFPNNFIMKLLFVISRHLKEANIVENINYNAEPAIAQPKGNYTGVVIRKLYKRYLYEAW
ncbi:RNA dependent RNA polymerase-domain-containing protein [Nemania sp. NC0429]|nr:RNA dependent RNA polymerase-domain-containing protein [Nemania sp. NC0429]